MLDTSRETESSGYIELQKCSFSVGSVVLPSAGKHLIDCEDKEMLFLAQSPAFIFSQIAYLKIEVRHSSFTCHNLIKKKTSMKYNETKTGWIGHPFSSCKGDTLFQLTELWASRSTTLFSSLTWFRRPSLTGWGFIWTDKVFTLIKE